METAASRLFSSWARTALAGAVLALAAVAAAVLLLGRGEGDGTEARRAAVSAYIVEINTTQQALILELERVSLAYRQLQLKAEDIPGQLAKVEAAEATLRRLRSRLEQLRAPAEARKLRAQLLELVDLQAALAAEVAGMVRYLPVQAAENDRLAAATKVLRDALAEAKSGLSQRQAFDDYGAVLRASVRRLERASAPAVLEPSRTGEVARLQKLAALSRQLGGALEEQRAEDVDRLFPRFVQTSASTGTTRAERQAVIVFNRRLVAIGKQRTAVAAERTRLDLALR